MKRGLSPNDAATVADCVRPRHILDFAFESLEDEHAKLFALAIALQDQLEPTDPDNHDDCDHITAWHLAQILCTRLAGTQFLSAMRRLITGVESPERN